MGIRNLGVRRDRSNNVLLNYSLPPQKAAPDHRETSPKACFFEAAYGRFIGGGAEAPRPLPFLPYSSNRSSERGCVISPSPLRDGSPRIEHHNGIRHRRWQCAAQFRPIEAFERFRPRKVEQITRGIRQGETDALGLRTQTAGTAQDVSHRTFVSCILHGSRSQGAQIDYFQGDIVRLQ